MELTFYQQLQAEEKGLLLKSKEINEELAAVRVLLKRHSGNNGTALTVKEPAVKQPAPANKKRKFAIPAYTKSDFTVKFKQDLSKVQKTYIALHQISNGFVEDVAKRLAIIDPTTFSDAKKTLKSAKDICSNLKIAGIFGVDYVGRRHKYYIKD